MNAKYIVVPLDSNLEIIPGILSPFAMPYGLGIMDTDSGMVLYKTYVNGSKQFEEVYDVCDAWNEAYESQIGCEIKA